MKYMMLTKESREALMGGLRQMPDFLAESFAELPDALRTRPGPDGSFSPVEQAWHLADLEAMGFAERIRRLMVETEPQLPDFAGDEIARQRDYKSLSLAEGIEAFRLARERNLATLDALTRAEWNRRGEQEGVGAVTLCDIPSMMAEHDESHRKEIREWLGRVES